MPLLENNLVLVGLGAVIFILIFVVCCMLMKMRKNSTRGASFAEPASARADSEMKNIYTGETSKRTSEMGLRGNESDRYADDRRDGVYLNSKNIGQKQADQDADAVYESVLRRSTKQLGGPPVNQG